MSAITGHLAYASRDIAGPVFAAFTHSLAHRGPEGFGIKHFPESRLWVGHQRLAILDLSERAQQPMSYADERYWLTHDGEIYNYLELRDELRGLGHRFISDCDAEVILAAYAQWGTECLLRFNGTWAFAIWDTRKRQLFLSRDRFGFKPLLYADYAGALAFASELKAFLTLPWVDGRFDPDVVAQTLRDTIGQEARSHTLLPHVRRLPAAHWMLVEGNGRMQIRPWWTTLDHVPTAPGNLPDQVNEFRSLFFDACNLRLQGKRHTAIEQSGGLDSSAIACAVAELDRHNERKRCERAFVACFPGTSRDESKQASIVINHTRMDPHYEYIDDQVALDNIERSIFDHEAIFLFPRVGSWVLFRAMRDAGIQVSLHGGAADSLLGNDRNVVELSLDAAISRLNVRRSWDLLQIMQTFDDDGSAGVGNTVKAAMRRLLRNSLSHLGLLKPLRTIVKRPRNARSESLIRTTAYPSDFSDNPKIADERLSLETAYYQNFHIANQLHYANFDRASMAHGIQIRAPFTDWRLVTFGFSLPETAKYGEGYTKRVLRLAMKNMMPDEVRLCTVKAPFVSPLNHWARGKLRPWLQDLCASESFLSSAIWNGPAVREALERALADQKASVWPIWPIINAYALERSFKQRAHALRPAET